jgi:putative ABC transport system permease protein
LGFLDHRFTMLGFGEPRLLHAGVVGGSYFDVMGLRPVLGRLLNASDDGRDAEGAVVLTHRFWTSFFKSDPSVIGKPIRLSENVLAKIHAACDPSGAMWLCDQCAAILGGGPLPHGPS